MARLYVSIATRSLFIIFRFNFIRFLKKKIFCKNIVLTYAPVFSNISETAGATVPIFELDLTIVNTIILSPHWLKSVNPFESYRAYRRTDGQTDRRTDGQTDRRTYQAQYLE